jgi:aminopeptidase N
MKRSLISAAVLALIGITTYPVAAKPAPAATSAQRALPTTQLPREVSPTHYALILTPDAANSTFAGKAAISITVKAPTASITLHANELAFSKATLAGGKGAPQDARVAVDDKAQTATFTFATPLAKGSYVLSLDYTGKIGKQAVGLFSLDYTTAEGKKRALYTQFENSDARRMIPSWDEPAHKATFALEAIVPANEMAVSNMPVASKSTLPDGRVHVKFAQTPKMSTYLLFFGLGEFDRATAMADGTEVGVVTRKGSVAQAAYALEASKLVVGEYNNYFGVRYPLPKLDNIAAPGRSQFFGAMENWGAIMTFESVMLVDPSISTARDKQAIFSIAAHEIAHQWFGNLVTMQWWDDLWLNEGFATWMESRMTARIHPEWNTILNAVNSREGAMQRDSVATTHPVVQHVETVEQASQAFDSITYEKGASVINMLETYVGADAWRAGVRAYMKAHAYGNTATDDLWREVEKAAKKPVTAIAHDFTLQPGVPMIRVDDVSCKGGNSVVSLSQGEFTRDREGKKPLAWRVPVIAQVGAAGKQARTLVVGGKASLAVPGCGAVVVNAGQSGYYRTLYAPKAFEALAKEFAQLAPIDQMGMLTDTWSLGMAGLQPASDILDLAKSVPLAADPQIWGRVAGVYNGINGMYADNEKARKRFAGYAIARLAPLMAQTGWEARAGEPDTVANLRTQLISTLANLGDEGVIGEARRRYAARDTDPKALPAALRRTVMYIVAEHADDKTWDALRAAAAAEKTPMIKDQYYAMLAAPQDKALAQRALDLSLTDEPGVTNSAAMISRVAGNFPDLSFDFALANIDKVNERVDSTSRARYFPGLASGSAKPEMIDKLRAYGEKHLAAGSRRDLETAITSINYRLKVRTERLPAIEAWLDRNAK